jgi:TolA-binding protein
LAKIALQRGNPEEAEAIFREYTHNCNIDKYINNAALAGLAASIEAQNRFSEAAEIYISIPRKYPKHYFCPEAVYQAARCYLWAGQKDKAIEACQMLQRQYPTSTLRSKAVRMLAQFP